MLTSPYRKPRLLPPAEHPRLMLREGDRERIEAGLSHPENRRAHELWQRVCKKDFCHFFDDIKAGKYSLMVCFMLEAKALDAWLTRDAQNAVDGCYAVR